MPIISLSNNEDSILHEMQTGIQPVEQTSSSVVNEEKQVNKDLTHDKIVQLTDKFMEKLIQDTDDHYRVQSYNTKEALVQEFKDIASKSLAKKYVDLYYKEQNQQLYIIPTETPAWFVPDQSYEKHVEDGHATIIQSNSSDLYGNYKIKMEFIYKEQKGWMIHKVYYPNRKF